MIIGLRREREVLTVALATGRHVALEGPPGTGKSTLLRAIARDGDRDVMFVEGNAELTPGRLVGSCDPSQVLVEGCVPASFVDGPLLMAMRSGSLEELNRVPEETLTALTEGEIVVPRLDGVDRTPESVVDELLEAHWTDEAQLVDPADEGKVAACRAPRQASSPAPGRAGNGRAARSPGSSSPRSTRSRPSWENSTPTLSTPPSQDPDAAAALLADLAVATDAQLRPRRGGSPAGSSRSPGSWADRRSGADRGPAGGVIVVRAAEPSRLSLSAAEPAITRRARRLRFPPWGPSSASRPIPTTSRSAPRAPSPAPPRPGTGS